MGLDSCWLAYSRRQKSARRMKGSGFIVAHRNCHVGRSDREDPTPGQTGGTTLAGAAEGQVGDPNAGFNARLDGGGVRNSDGRSAAQTLAKETPHRQRLRTENWGRRPVSRPTPTAQNVKSSSEGSSGAASRARTASQDGHPCTIARNRAFPARSHRRRRVVRPRSCADHGARCGTSLITSMGGRLAASLDEPGRKRGSIPFIGLADGLASRSRACAPGNSVEPLAAGMRGAFAAAHGLRRGFGSRRSRG